MEDSVVAIMVIMGDLDMVGGVILTGGTTPMILTIPTMIPSMIPTTILITGVMGNRRCLQRGLAPRQHLDNSNLLIGTSVRIQRVTTPTLKIVGVVG